MVFAWPEPPNARFAGKSAGARCGVQETCASGGTEAPTNRPGKKKLAAETQRSHGGKMACGLSTVMSATITGSLVSSTMQTLVSWTETSYPAK